MQGAKKGVLGLLEVIQISKYARFLNKEDGAKVLAKYYEEREWCGDNEVDFENRWNLSLHLQKSALI